MLGAHYTLLQVPALVRLVSGLTGLHLALLPAPTAGRAWDIRRLIAGCRAQGPRATGARPYSRCEACGLTHLRKALAAPRQGHSYSGPCGVRSFLLCVAGDSGRVGLLVLRQQPACCRRGAHAVATRVGGRDAVFRRAVRLLRPMAHAATWTATREGHAAGNWSAGGVEAPYGPVARARAGKPTVVCETRARLAVRALTERLQREFTEPLDLGALAREYRLNASYLSTVFAREAGLPFKAYLTALRLQHAQVLLGNPRLPISRVAKKAGYASPRRFRAAFRSWTGVSPGRWRAARCAGSGRWAEA